MPILNIYSSPTTPGQASWQEDLTGAIRLGSIQGLSGEARLGATGVGSITYDDPTSTLGHLADGVVGLKQMHFTELSCPIGNQRLWTGYVGDREYRRGEGDSLITGAARKIDVTLIDLNDFLGFRVFAPTADDPTSDFVRPAETDLERVEALLTTVDFISTTLFDVGYIPSTGGVDMSANDYTGMRPIDVLNDCAQVSGRNFWVKYHEATNQYVLWYDVWTTDGSGTLVYDSPLRLTNVLSEVNGTTTFAGIGAKERVDPSRVVSATYLSGDGLTTYQTNPTTAYIYAWRDSVAPAVFVKDQAKLDSLAVRYLLDNSTEDHTISVSVQLPNQYVTGIHEGMRLEVHFTHLPSVNAGFTWTRVLSRTIRVDVETQQYYWLDLELSPLPAGEAPFSILYGAHSGGTTVAGDPSPIYFGGDGDAPQAGYPPAPTVGLLTIIPRSPPIANEVDQGWTIGGTGTVDVVLHTTVAGVPLAGDVYTVEIWLNGSPVGSDSITCSVNFSWPTNELNVSVSALAVVPGDEIICIESSTPRTGFFAPAGAGDHSVNFTITGGLLV